MHAIVLKYFAEVALQGSVRKAAEKLHVAPSAVNRQILQVEEEFGVELFDRLPKGLQLNAAGERLLRHVQATLFDFEVVRTEIDALKGERTGHIRVVSMDSLFVDLLPTVVEEFSRSFPAATYTVTAASPIDVPGLIQSGQTDIGCTFVGRIPTGVTLAASAAMPLGVVMPPGHPLAAKSRITLAQCGSYPFMRSSTSSAVTTAMSPEFAKFWEETEPVATVTSTIMLKRLICAGKGISVFSKIAFVEELARGELVWRPFDLESMNQIRVGILVPSQRALPHVAQNFLARMIKKLKLVEVATAQL
ncbi:LysR family transcriptional regulator [Caenimonas aquaedulcis]|uniref:LysR family transcriptional regulator n=1 Tax=Caenimonas aquaedulcis TaxID=2793270 RepID=A0A931H132_9BURK|nr:LysR family transcriptional regulator [Caenimonas aquaedulcis]MBG9386595.1 LysR family transcriptional regulator [Caenimonas aquaedulcis]